MDYTSHSTVTLHGTATKPHFSHIILFVTLRLWIHLRFGYTDGNLPKESSPQVWQFFSETTCISAKIEAKDITLSPTHKVAAANCAVTVSSLCLYSLWWFLHCAILLETQQLLLDSFQRVREVVVFQLQHLDTDPLQQITCQSLIMHFHIVCIHHLPHNLQEKYHNTISKSDQMQASTAILKHFLQSISTKQLHGATAFSFIR